jgi:segregation and condensation protein B
MSQDKEELVNIIEAALLAAGKPLSIDRMLTLFMDELQPSRDEIRDALKQLGESCENRGIELKEVNSGFRMQVKQDYAPWISRLWEEKPARYSRALMETLALIAYRQPITRAEVEEVRGVAVSTNIVRTLMEREWVRVVGHRDVPGKPAMYATTRQFLDCFNLKTLNELPTLAEIRDIDEINAELQLSLPGEQPEVDQAQTDAEQYEEVVQEAQVTSEYEEEGQSVDEQTGDVQFIEVHAEEDQSIEQLSEDELTSEETEQEYNTAKEAAVGCE